MAWYRVFGNDIGPTIGIDNRMVSSACKINYKCNDYKSEAESNKTHEKLNRKSKKALKRKKKVYNIRQVSPILCRRGMAPLKIRTGFELTKF